MKSYLVPPDGLRGKMESIQLSCRGCGLARDRGEESVVTDVIYVLGTVLLFVAIGLIGKALARL